MLDDFGKQRQQRRRVVAREIGGHRRLFAAGRARQACAAEVEGLVELRLGVLRAAQQQRVAGQVRQPGLGAVVDRAGFQHGAHGDQRRFVAFHQDHGQAVRQARGFILRQAEFGGAGAGRQAHQGNCCECFHDQSSFAADAIGTVVLDWGAYPASYTVRLNAIYWCALRESIDYLQLSLDTGCWFSPTTSGFQPPAAGAGLHESSI